MQSIVEHTLGTNVSSVVAQDGTVSVAYNLGPYGSTWGWSQPATFNLGYVNQFNIIFGDLNGKEA